MQYTQMIKVAMACDGVSASPSIALLRDGGRGQTHGEYVEGVSREDENRQAVRIETQDDHSNNQQGDADGDEAVGVDGNVLPPRSPRSRVLGGLHGDRVPSLQEIWTESGQPAVAKIDVYGAMGQKRETHVVYEEAAGGARGARGGRNGRQRWRERQ